jgi:hypothetical protein
MRASPPPVAGGVRGACIVAILLGATAARAQPAEWPTDEWQIGASSGFAILTYPSTASLRPLLFPPMSAPPCHGCISSAGEGVELEAARWIGPVLRLAAAVDASRHPSVGTDVYGAAVGPGVGTRMGHLAIYPHGDVLLGASRFAGPVDATSFAIHIVIGVDIGVARGLTVGFEGSGAFFYGAQPAGDGSRGLYALRVAYRWR